MTKVGIATFQAPGPNAVSTLATAPPLWCASVLKPLYFWAARPLLAAGWEELAEPAVTRSANAPTTALWDECGGAAILEELRRRSGVAFADADQVGDPWGRVRVTADQLAGAYAALLADPGEAAASIRAHLRQVPDEHVFGMRTEFAQLHRVPAEEVMAKSGWFCAPGEHGLRTHVVLAHATPDRLHGIAVTTFVPTTPNDQRRYRQTYVEGHEVLPLHTAAAGPLLSEAIRRSVAHP